MQHQGTGNTVMMPRYPCTVRSDQTTREDLILVPGVLVSGRVTDETTGAPIHGANLVAMVARELGPLRPGVRPGIASCRTDEDGRYVLRLPWPGQIDLYFNGVTPAYQPPDPSVVSKLSIVEGLEDIEDLDFVLKPREPGK